MHPLIDFIIAVLFIHIFFTDHTRSDYKDIYR